MQKIANHPDQAKLRALLDGTLSEVEQAEVLALVEANPSWQQALDSLAAGAQTWHAAAEHLQQPPLRTDAALRSAIAAAQMPTAASDQVPVAEAKLDFLSPVDDPNYLGRFGEYLVERVIGRGGFGIVLRAFDPPLRRIVALKVLAPHLASNRAACLRFAREAKAAAAVVHDHVITIHAVGEEPLPHLVMQYVAGHSLQEKLDRCGPLEIKEVLRIGMQTAAGLAAAHKHGEVHRDIKPANILLENGIERVKITDFGLARAADDASMTQSGVVAGTPQYMSPEQARGDTVDARSDLFSLGSVMYAMCAGHPPFRATTTMGVLKRVCDDPPRPIREVNPEVQEWLAAIIERLMAKNPTDRYSSAAEVSELLGQCLSHVQQPSTAPLPQSRPLAPRGPELPQAVASPTSAATATASEEVLLDRARRAVREPAIGLIITGILNWVALAVIMVFFSHLFQDMLRNDTYRWLIPVILVLGVGSGFIVLGGLKMLRLENRFLVTLASIAAMFIGPGYFVGFAMGLWALVVLQRREVKQAFARVSHRHWMGPVEDPAELPEEGEWSGRCLTCGYVAPLHKWGGVRIGARSRGKWSVLWCPLCRWFRWMSIERFSAKSLPESKPFDPRGPELPQAAGSSTTALVLLVLFLLVAIPLVLLFAAGVGYFLMHSGPAPVASSPVPYLPEITGALIVQNPDSRLKIIIHRVKTADGEHVVGATLGPDFQHNQYLNIPPGEYHARVLSGETPVREDTFQVAKGGPPTTYSVPAGGTLRIVTDAAPGTLFLALNDLAHWRWNGADDQSFVIPEGLVHVDVRRADANGVYKVLTDNYFDIVAGQETLLRVREKEVELAPGGIAFDAIIAAQGESLKSVETAYAQGRTTKIELIAAQLALARARLDWAMKENRPALAISVRQEIVALAEESERIVGIRREAGAIPEMELHEARVVVLKEQEALKQAVEELKASGKLPADFELPAKQETEGQAGAPVEKAEPPPE